MQELGIKPYSFICFILYRVSRMGGYTGQKTTFYRCHFVCWSCQLLLFSSPLPETRIGHNRCPPPPSFLNLCQLRLLSRKGTVYIAIVRCFSASLYNILGQVLRDIFNIGLVFFCIYSKLLHLPLPRSPCMHCKCTVQKIRKKYSQVMKLRGLIPSFYIHVSVSILYIPTIGPQTQYSKIGGPIVGIYKSVTDT